MHGYSSSSDSDDPRRPKAAATTTTSTTEQKKKVKRKIPPQQLINRTWKTFQTKKFNTALSVLPFDPVLPPASPDRANELLSAGYERAAEECKRKVNKIIQECRRVNLRYRDRGFDLDWDLKMEKGHCLNHLGQKKWQLNKTSLSSPNAAVPKAVKRVHEIYEKPTFMENLSGGEIKQGSLGDCWFMASLTGLANVDDGLKRICVAYDTRIGIYGFVFYRDGEWVYSIIDDKLYLKSPCWDSPSMQRDLLQQIDREDVERVYRKTYQTGSKALFFAQCRDQNETWVPLIEKAYAKAHGDYASLSGGWVGEGLEDLSGGVTTELLTADILDVDGFWDNELSKVNQEFIFGCSTGLLEYGYGSRNGISEGHAYNVMEARTLKSGQRLVKLRNPWGKIRKGTWEGAWSDGSKEWTAEVQEELGHQFGNDSVFWIGYEDLLQKYSHFDRTRLFRDPDWRCCQRWIGVEVPWKAAYHEKFHIKLTRDSPLVMVLAQLDSRYFKGLQGQYTFRLHFRLHEQGRPDAEDYIVRSHGNYLMGRSVSVELPDMPAGNYTVFIRVTAERDTDLPSVEEAVKRECKQRVENEKLAQVGHAYDLAHSKGAAHLLEVARLRKITDQQKASDSRKAERRRLWERRHLNRDVTKRQTKKNTEKRQRKSAAARAKAEAEAEEKRMKESEEVKGKEEEKPMDRGVQTETPAEKDKKDEPENKDKAATNTDEKDENKPADSSASSEASESPINTPKSEDAAIAPSTSDKQPVPPVDEQPKTKTTPVPPAPPVAYESDGESSDSPIEDWEELYSSDDMTRKPRLTPAGPPLPKESRYDTEEEGLPDPWNATCVVGFRVYSKDEDLEVRVVMEGGKFLEGGMGMKGEADLDNAQSNAGGEREKESSKTEEDGFAPYPTIVKAGEEFEKAKAEGRKIMEDRDKKDEVKEKDEEEAAKMNEETKEDTREDTTEDSKSEKSSDSSDYVTLDSGATTPVVLLTPEPTPLDSTKELC